MHAETTTSKLGVIARYREYLPVSDTTPIVSLGEGGTPLVFCPRLSERVGRAVFIKNEGTNPTGSFKDRGMSVAVSKAMERKAKALICKNSGKLGYTLVSSPGWFVWHSVINRLRSRKSS